MLVYMGLVIIATALIAMLDTVYQMPLFNTLFLSDIYLILYLMIFKMIY